MIKCLRECMSVCIFVCMCVLHVNIFAVSICFLFLFCILWNVGVRQIIHSFSQFVFLPFDGWGFGSFSTFNRLFANSNYKHYSTCVFFVVVYFYRKTVVHFSAGKMHSFFGIENFHLWVFLCFITNSKKKKKERKIHLQKCQQKMKYEIVLLLNVQLFLVVATICCITDCSFVRLLGKWE